MKKKNRERRLRKWVLKIGIALIIFPVVIPLMLLSFVSGWLTDDVLYSTPEDVLLSRIYRDTNVFTILHEQQLTNPDETLYLVGWIVSDETSCIDVFWVEEWERGSFFPSIGDFGSKADCFSARYSIDQYWQSRIWHAFPFSAAYGYSGDAAHVVVTWQDKTVNKLTPVNGVYLAVRDKKSRVIESVDFYSATGLLLHRFPDSARSSGA